MQGSEGVTTCLGGEVLYVLHHIPDLSDTLHRILQYLVVCNKTPRDYHVGGSAAVKTGRTCRSRLASYAKMRCFTDGVQRRNVPAKSVQLACFHGSHGHRWVSQKVTLLNK